MAEVSLIIFGLCTIVVALIFAAFAGESTVKGDVLGKYICIAAALVLAVISTAAFHSAGRLTADEQPKCPQCKTEIVEEYHYCPVCGYELEGEGNGK